MNQQRGVSLRVSVVLLLAALIPVTAGAQSSPPEPPAASAAEPQDEQDYILYQIRPGEDPSKVAHMFHLTVEQLLALNRISDPHRLSVGATLKIPDPRAVRLNQLRSEKDTLAHQLAAVQGAMGDLENTTHALESQMAELRDAKQMLEHRQMLYPVWRTAVFITTGAAACAVIGLLVVLAKAHDEARRRHLAVKEVELLHVAIEKHRQLGAQFELRYQNLFNQSGVTRATQDRAQALRQAYDEDRARLDAIVEEAERDITGTAAARAADTENHRNKTPVVRLSAARKSG
jgi:LysM repeat protein